MWEPYETIFAEQEYVINDFRGYVITRETIKRGQRIINSLTTGKEYAVDFIDDENFFNALNAKVNVARVVT